MIDLDKIGDEFLNLLVEYAEAHTTAYNDDTASSQRAEEDLCGQVLAAHRTLLDEIKRLRYRCDESKIVLDGWQLVGETISHFIPEHYEASEGAFMGIVEDWAKDAAHVVSKAHTWRKRGRTEEDGDKLDAAVEKIYPSEDFL
jgi:hypothetical protein